MKISNRVREAVLNYLLAYEIEEKNSDYYSDVELRELDSLIGIFESGIDPTLEVVDSLS